MSIRSFRSVSVAVGLLMIFALSACQVIAPIPVISPPPVITPGISVGQNPTGIAITPDGTKAYVTRWSSGSVAGKVLVINTATNTLVP